MRWFERKSTCGGVSLPLWARLAALAEPGELVGYKKFLWLTRSRRSSVTHRTVDLSSHINQTVEHGNPADFPVTLQPVFVRKGADHEAVPHRVAVVRADTNQSLSVVSDRYTLVPHQRILDIVDQATARLDVGPVPRGVFVDRNGGRMRALFKFPALARPVRSGDEICPCLKIQNTYDGSSRIGMHIGAFRFVCTNLAVGGGGAFASGFMAVHAGEIPIAKIADELLAYLTSFDRIVELYRLWTTRSWTEEMRDRLVDELPKRLMMRIVNGQPPRSIFDAYNAATWYATHETRSYRTAFDLLERINRAFQQLVN